MDLTRRWARMAVGRASVLVAEVPGWAAPRLEVERAVRRRGWRLALSPADADVFLTCGAPGPRLREALDHVWTQLPGPRARADLTSAAEVDAALDGVAAALLDADAQRRDAAARPGEPDTGPAAETGEGDGGDHEGMDDGDDDADEGGGTDHGDMDMEMDMPGGIPLAGGGGEDRDGLDLDVLHVPLGPVLPSWPAGLVLHCTLAGDVVTEARPEVLGAAGDAESGEPLPAAVDRLDRAVAVLALAGWDAAALAFARLRDDPMTVTDPRSRLPLLDRWGRRVRRSRMLRWSLGGVGRLGGDECRRHGVDPRLAGDAHDRLLALLDEARAALEGGTAEPTRTPVDVLADVVPGHELGAVRLLVAGLDLDTGARVPAGTGAGG